MRILIVDIDGTIANIQHRLHHLLRTPKQWDAFYDAAADDTLITDVADVIRDIHAGAFHGTYYVTGRPERIRGLTEAWLRRHGMPDPLSQFNGLCMRADGDFRPDFVVKREILHQLRAKGLNPAMAIEDRSQVAKMWREEGLTCLQVANGDY